MDYTRIVFGVHRNGYLIPSLLSVREGPTSATAPTFLVLMRELMRNDDNFLLLRANFNVSGASPLAFSVMGINVAALETNDVNIRDLVQEWDGVVDDLRCGHTVTMQVAEARGVLGDDDEATPSDSGDDAGDSDAGSINSASARMSDAGSVDGGGGGAAGGGGRGRSGRGATGGATRHHGGGGGGGGGGTAWIRAHMQQIPFANGDIIYVLHWRVVPLTDLFTIRKAEAKREGTTGAVRTVATLPATASRLPKLPSPALAPLSPTRPVALPASATLPPLGASSTGAAMRGRPPRIRAPAASPPTTVAAVVSARPDVTASATVSATVGGGVGGVARSDGTTSNPIAAPASPLAQPELPGVVTTADHAAVGDAAHTAATNRTRLGAAEHEPPLIVRPADYDAAIANMLGVAMPAGAPAAEASPPWVSAVQIESSAGESAAPTEAVATATVNVVAAPAAGPSLHGVGSGTNPTPPTAEDLPSIRVDRRSTSGDRRRRLRVNAASPHAGLPLAPATLRASPAGTLPATTPHARDATDLAPASLRHGVPTGVSGLGSGGSAVGGMTAPGDGKSEESSGTAATRMLGRLRRVINDPNPPLLPGLRYLRTTGLLLSGLAISLAVVITITTRNSFLSYADHVAYVQGAATRLVSTFNAIIPLQDLVAANAGYMPPGGHTVGLNASEAEDTLRGYVVGNMTTFSTWHRYLYSLIQGTSTVTLYNTPFVCTTRFDMPGGGDSGITVMQNLFEAGVGLAAALTRIATLPFSNLTEHHPDVRYVFVNGVPGGNVHESLHASMEDGFLKIMESRSTVQLTQIVAFSCMAVLIAILMVVFAFILTTIERAKDAIAIRFVQLPPVVRQLLYKQAVARYRALRSTYLAAEDDDSMDDEDDGLAPEEYGGGGGGGMDGGGGMGGGAGGVGGDGDGMQYLRGNAPAPAAAGGGAGAAPGGGGGGGGGGTAPGTGVVTDDEGDVDWAQVMSGNAAARGGGGSRRTPPPGPLASPSRGAGSSPSSVRSLMAFSRRSRHSALVYRKSSSSFILLSLRFVGPLVALFVFFAVIFGVSLRYIDVSLVMAGVATSAMERASCSRETVMDVQHLLSSYGERTYMREQYSLVLDTADCTARYDKLLAFGTPPDEATPYTELTVAMENGRSDLLTDAENSLVYTAMFSDACPFIASLASGPFDLARCRNFGSGIVQQGLHAVVSEYVRIAKMVSDRRMRARLVYNSSASMTGFLLDAVAYNYTQDDCEVYNECLAGFAGLTADVVQTPAVQPSLDYDGDVPADWVTSGAAPARTTAYSLAGEIMGDSIAWLREADALYLTPALFGIANVYATKELGIIAEFISFLSIFVSVFLVAFVLANLSYILPQVRATNQDIQTKRSVLLYLPPEVVSHAPAIKELVREILASDADNIVRGAKPSSSLGPAADTSSIRDVSSPSSPSRNAKFRSPR